MLLNGVPDDFHHHFRDGEALKLTVPSAARQFRRALAMPNLKPPVTTTAMALAYRDRILAHVPSDYPDFSPLMTLYLTDVTTPEEIELASKSGHVVGVKYYPAGATTNSEAGVTDLKNVYPTLEAMIRVNMPLLIHGEVTTPEVDVFDREATFISSVLSPLVKRYPTLSMVVEHITTAEAVAFVTSAHARVGATITPHHLMLNRNAIFSPAGLNPHHYCLPVLKRERHRRALVEALASGNAKFFLGTDSAPHVRHRKESSCGCAGIFSSPVAMEILVSVCEDAGCLDQLEGFSMRNGARFYGLPPNEGQTQFLPQAWTVPETLVFDDGVVVPLCAGQTLGWKKQA